jgi:hypothetical protein
MRGVVDRGAVVVVSVIVSAGAFAAPRAAQSQDRAIRTVRKIIRSLGDFLTVPTPAPTPAPKQP